MSDNQDNSTQDSSSDQNTQDSNQTPVVYEDSDRPKRKILPWAIGIGVGGAIVLGIVLIIIFTRKSTTSSGSGGGSKSSSTTSTGTVPSGGTCTNIGDCVYGTYCAQNSTCMVGTPKQTGDNCTDHNQCVIGTYCPTGVQQCVTGGPGLFGDTCQTNTDCSIPYICQSQLKVCATTSTSTSSSTVPSCTKLGVYRLIHNTDFQLLESTSPTLPDGTWTYYPNALPIWYGCATGGTGMVPLYRWLKSSTGDSMWSPSNLTLFTGGSGNQGYSVTNSGQPIFYVYSSKVSDSVLPLYSLYGHQDDFNIDYHCSAVNTTTINGGWGSIVYNSGTVFDGPSGTGLLGYVYIA